jgi:hypothetical protein
MRIGRQRLLLSFLLGSATTTAGLKNNDHEVGVVVNPMKEVDGSKLLKDAQRNVRQLQQDGTGNSMTVDDSPAGIDGTNNNNVDDGYVPHQVGTEVFWEFDDGWYVVNKVTTRSFN